ncbi:hypothetical protein P170DRAFT_426533 [Aspergillus steynii IBT 23096]|uniref:Protein kinase domain-containing protein n=1 Tax=Aspergillus steynii IBT 23096 TaxID=1392250 RepID=A0A2I2G9V0_9EURO|nr:uncharacterized protein P170DRAFT_426533 [Aspergillus steynii IBT 23096]PLB49656.1 hypothetical protein P170DRAFT_426533 [Aspergillus steynii IBT 23096]
MSFYDQTLGMLTGATIPSSKTSTLWSLGKILTYKTRVHDENEGSIEEITGTCIATQVAEQPTPDTEVMEVIVKIKIQLTPWDNPDIQTISSEAWREIENLEELTKAECSSTPRLIEYFSYKQHNQMYCPGGYIVFIVMEKVPGHDLQNFEALPLEERDSVRIAFIRALWEFTEQGFVHEDPRRENIIWDKASQRCVIVDLEDVWNMELPKGGNITLDPVNELSLWWLNSGVAQPVDGHSMDDPMMPEPRKEGWTFNSLEEAVAFLQSGRGISLS